MHSITVRNVNEALSDGFYWLRAAGEREPSRNGDVIVSPVPVCTTYLKPWERVLFNPVRDANPAFHLMEAIWMLAGGSDVSFLLKFNGRFNAYAEDDGQVWGAYGHRWRSWFGVDQIVGVTEELRRNPESRRAVIAMWSPEHDLGADKRDIPCNTTIYFDRRGGKLNMTVCCRSNDILWGAYGANAVHMSILQELIAAALEVPIGRYNQFSNNFHAYTNIPQAAEFLKNPPLVYDFYDSGIVTHTSLIRGGETAGDFLHDCALLVSSDGFDLIDKFDTSFFRCVAYPLHEMYLDRKEGGEKYTKKEIMQTCPGNDWLTAFADWCERRDRE